MYFICPDQGYQIWQIKSPSYSWVSDPITELLCISMSHPKYSVEYTYAKNVIVYLKSKYYGSLVFLLYLFF